MTENVVLPENTMTASVILPEIKMDREMFSLCKLDCMPHLAISNNLYHSDILHENLVINLYQGYLDL